jgi:hypothetical protein
MTYFPQGISPLGYGPDLPSGGTEYKLWWKSSDTLLTIYRWIESPSGWQVAHMNGAQMSGVTLSNLAFDGLTGSGATISCTNELNLSATTVDVLADSDIRLSSLGNINIVALSTLSVQGVNLSGLSAGAPNSAVAGYRMLMVPN